MKILIVGSGSIAKRHLNNLRLLKYTDIIVLKRKYDHEFENRYNVKVVTSYSSEFLIDLDCIFICTPTSIHLEALKFANENNLHVFMEKPMVHDYNNFLLSKNIWTIKKNIFFIGYMLRFHPAIKHIEHLVKIKKYGSVYSARFEFGSYLPNWHPDEDYKISYASQMNLGGGVVRTISHELDLAQFFFGNPQEIKSFNLNTGILNINVEEISESILFYSDKIVSIHLDLLQKKYHRSISILFENGRLEWSWDNNKILIAQASSDVEIIDFSDGFDINNLYLDELKYFFYLINNNIINHSLDFHHSLLNTELMLKIYNNGQ